MKLMKLLPALLAALALALSCAACGPAAEESLPPPPPAETISAPPTFEPEKAGAGQPARIVMYTMFSSSAYDSVASRVNAGLSAAGQAVKIELRGDPYGGRGDALKDKLSQELQAGKPSADAYALDTGMAEALFSGGHVMDPSALLTNNAPNYRARYEKLFPNPMHGIPVNLYGRPLILRPALVLRQEIEPSVDTGTIDGFLAFLDRDIRPSPIGWKVVAQPIDLVNQWALEQGYYALDWFGVGGGLYLKLDDGGFTPMPLERLPGFEAFVQRLAGYYNGGPLNTMGEQGMGATPAGMVKKLGEYYILNPLVAVTASDGQFTAHPFTPDLPACSASPDYMNELVLPAVCPEDKAAAIARFVEWLYASQDNYDVVAYGKKGVDFSEAGGRFQPLLDGTPVQVIAGEAMTKLTYLWPGAEVFGNNEFLRLPAYAPDNLEKLIEAEMSSGSTPPLQQALSAHPDAKKKIAAVTEQMSTVIALRKKAIDDLLMAGSPNAGQLGVSLEQLKSSEADRLIDAYAAALDGIRKQ